MNDIVERLYSERYAPDLEPWFGRHMSAMTVEDLHSKSDIACELAVRDIEIERLRAEIAELRNDQGEPLAYLKISNISGERTLSFSEECQSQKMVPLYTAEPSIPEGWKLVPMRPTPEMKGAGEHERTSHPTNMNPVTTWQAMLAAAPKHGVDKQ